MTIKRLIHILFFVLVILTSFPTTDLFAEDNLLTTKENNQSVSEESSVEKLRRMKEKVGDKSSSNNNSSKTQTPDRSSYGQAIKGLFLCLGVFFILVFILKKLNKVSVNSSGSRLNVIERASLGGKNSLMLVEVDNQELIIAITENNVVQLFKEQKNFFNNNLQNQIARAVPCINE